MKFNFVFIRLKIWLKVINNPKLFQIQDHYLQNNARICATHFKDWTFTGTNKKRLIRYAVPFNEQPPLEHVSPCTERTYNPHVIRVSAISDLPGTSRATSPKSKRLLHQQSVISRLRQKIFKLKTPPYLKDLKQKLNVEQYNFVLAQINMSSKAAHGRRWGKTHKAFALNIYLQSPSAYAILRRKLAFPSKSTLKRCI